MLLTLLPFEWPLFYKVDLFFFLSFFLLWFSLCTPSPLFPINFHTISKCVWAILVNLNATKLLFLSHNLVLYQQNTFTMPLYSFPSSLCLSFRFILFSGLFVTQNASINIDNDQKRQPKHTERVYIAKTGGETERKSDNRLNKFILYAKQWKDPSGVREDEKCFQFCFGWLFLCVAFHFSQLKLIITKLNRMLFWYVYLILFSADFVYSNFKLENEKKHWGTTHSSGLCAKLYFVVSFFLPFISNEKPTQKTQSCCFG